MSTGAVIAGRRTYEHAGRWGGDHDDGVPVLVLTDGDAMVHGAGAAQALLRVGEFDLVRRWTTPEVEDLVQHVTHLRYRVHQS